MVVVVVTPLERVERPDVARWRDRHPFASQEVEALVDPPDLDLGGSGKTCVGREIAVDEHPPPVLVHELVPGERVHVHLAEVHVARIERRACGFAVITPSMVISRRSRRASPAAGAQHHAGRDCGRRTDRCMNAITQCRALSSHLVLRTCGERTRSDPARHRLPPLAPLRRTTQLLPALPRRSLLRPVSLAPGSGHPRQPVDPGGTLIARRAVPPRPHRLRLPRRR